jgi:hypothetical protein
MIPTSTLVNATLRELLASEPCAAQLRDLVSAARKEHGEAAGSYAIELSLGGEGSCAEYPNLFYFDAQHSLLLVYEEESGGAIIRMPIACISFSVIGTRPSLLMPPYRILVRQMQAVAYSPPERRFAEVLVPLVARGISSIRWERLLLKCVVALAERIGWVSAVRVQAAVENGYYAPAPCSEKLARRNRSLEMRYDVTPKRCGFIHNPKLRHYERAIPAAADP